MVVPLLAKEGPPKAGEVKSMTEFFNREAEKDVRRTLRASMPKAEVLLWSRLRVKQLSGLKFRRQYSIGPFAVDFYCPELKLAIELDGESHSQEESLQRDAERQGYIEGFGIRFLRFTNNEIYDNLEGVLMEIARIAGKID